MTVSAPPRPPSPARTAPDSKPLEREEVEALIEALIEEARRETRRRHRTYWALAALAAFVGIVVLILLAGGAASQTASPSLAERFSPAAAPVRSRIAFVAGVYKRSPTGTFVQAELYVMNADGSGLRRLVRTASGHGPDPWGGGPVWSPDGLKLAFGKRLGPAIGQCGVCHAEIFVVNADGTGQRSLTGNLGHGDAPAWSPDGQTIAFSGARDNSSIPNLYVMNADGSGQRRVTQDAAFSGDGSLPAWSPDGRRLAFAGAKSPLANPPPQSDVYVVNVDGSGLQQLTRDPGPDGFPAWSRDGRRIAYMTVRDERPRGGRRQQLLMYVMNADGSEQRKLARLSDTAVQQFSWSPDGRRIAFVSERDGNDEVYVINVDGSGLRNLTRNPARDWLPEWSPDGRTIGFISYRGGKGDIYVMNTDGSRQRNLTRGLRQQAFGIAWSPAQKR